MNRVKVFARLQTSADHNSFVDGLLCEDLAFLFLLLLSNHMADEIALRRKIAELQEYRRAGLPQLSEVEKYERDKGARVSFWL